MSFINAASVRFHDLCRSLFNVEVALRKDPASSRGKRATPKSRVLRLEALENRELLSVEPILSASFESADAALVAPAPEQTPIAVTTSDVDDASGLVVLSEADMQELVSHGVLDDSLAEKLASTQWTAGKRWFYYDDGMEDKRDEGGNLIKGSWDGNNLVPDGFLIQTINQAADANLNGMVWKCYVEDIENPETDNRALFLKKVKEYANDKGIEIIPTVWAVGYGAFLSKNINLVEGVHVLDVPLKVSDGIATSDRTVDSVTVNNYGMEKWTNSEEVPDYWHKELNISEVFSSQSTTERHSGTSSLEIAPFEFDSTKTVYSDPIKVKTGGYYTVSCWVKTNDIKDGWHAAELQIVDASEKEIDYACYTTNSDIFADDNGWRLLKTPGFVAQSDTITIKLKGTGDPGEKYYFDDVVVESGVGIILPIQREGAPIAVRGVKDGVVIEYESVSNGVTNWRLPSGYKLEQEPYHGEIYATINGAEYNNEIYLEIPGDSQILKDGVTELRVDYYMAKYCPTGSNYYYQYGVCLSEDELYEQHMRKSAEVVQEVFAPKTWFLGFDEVRIGGNCQTCHDSRLTVAKIFGKSLSRQCDIIRNTEGVPSDVEIVVWNDMFDPNSNAKDSYEYVDGSLVDVIDYIPNDLIIACWYDSEEKDKMTVDEVCSAAKKTLQFFSEKGFRTITSTYYDWVKKYKDEEDPESARSQESPYDEIDLNTQGWLKAIYELNQSGDLNNVGAFYLTWKERGDYDYLDSFGNFLNEVKNVDDATSIESVSINASVPVIGQTLTASLSPVADAQTAATYQWYRTEEVVDKDGNPNFKIWKAIGNATTASYTPTSDDVGKELKVAAVGIGNYSGTVFALTSPVRREDLGVADIAVSDPGKISNVAIVPNGAWSVDGIVVTNAGESESEDVALSFYATVSGTIDERSIFLKKIVCNRLAPGEVATVSSGILPTDGLELGQAYRIVWKAECSNDVATANNVGSTAKNVTVCPEADPVDVVDFDRESYSPRQGDAFWLATWLNSGATGPNKHAFWFDFGDGTYVERANSGVVMPNDYPSAAGNTTISVKVVDLTIKKIVAKGTASLNIVQATPSFYIEPESAFDGDALILSVEAFFPVPTAVSKWTFDWGDGEKTVLEQLSLKANASHYYAPNHKLRVVTLSVAFDDADFSVTFDAETLRQ